MTARDTWTNLVGLSLLHMATDCFGSFMPALWLVLSARFQLPAWKTGLLVSVSLIPANFLQPVIGFIADRFDARWLIGCGPLVAMVSIGLLGLSHDLSLTLAMGFVGMMGVGMFHPEAATFASHLSPRGSARMMGLFLAAGFLGQAIGPWYISLAITDGRTFSDSWLTVGPGLMILALGVLLIGRLPRHVAAVPARVTSPTGRAAASRASTVGRYRTITCLIGTHVARLFTLNVVLYTIPVYVKQHGLEQRQLGLLMMIYLGGQAAGILVGGLSAPLHRDRLLLIVSMLITLVPFGTLLVASGPVALFGLAATGIAISWTIPTAVRLGQDLVPGSQRWISGMLMGFTWGTAAISVPPLVGYLADTRSWWHALLMGAIGLVAALGFALAIPGQRHLNRFKRPNV